MQVFDSTVATSDGEVLFKGTDVAFRKAPSFQEALKTKVYRSVGSEELESDRLLELQRHASRSRQNRSRKPWKARWRRMTRKSMRPSSFISRDNPCNSVAFPAVGAVVGVEAVEVARGGLYPPKNTPHPDPCSFRFEH